VRPLRICLYTSTYTPTVGGQEEVVDRQAQFLCARGHQVVVVAPRVRHRDNRLDRPFRVVRFAKPTSQRYGVSQVALYLALVRLRWGMDLLHAHGLYPAGFVASQFARLWPVPLVLTAHGGDIEPAEEVRTRPLFARRLARTLARADAVTAISTAIHREYRTLGVAEERIFDVANGVEVAAFRAPPPAPYPRPYCLALGLFFRKKGFDVLIAAWARLDPALRARVDLVIAGAGQEEGALRRQVAAAGLEKNISFPGLVRGLEKVAWLAHAEVVVVPSRREPFGLVVAEALAAGRPVVASRVGGICDMVRDGVEGLLVEPEQPDALAAGLARLLADAPLRGRLATAAAQRAVAYDWARLLPGYEAVYQRLVEER